MKYAHVTWEDSCGSDEIWDDDPDEIRPLKIESCGILLREHSDHILLTLSIDEGPKYDGLLAIPKSAIRKLEILTPE